MFELAQESTLPVHTILRMGILVFISDMILQGYRSCSVEYYCQSLKARGKALHGHDSHP